MISIEQFLKDVQNATYPVNKLYDHVEQEGLILQGMTTKRKLKAAKLALEMVIDEGSLKEKNGMLYISTPVELMFEDAKDIVCCENEYNAQLSLPGALYPISCKGRSHVIGRDDPAIVALLCSFDKWFGYDTACADGIIGLKFEDIEKQHSLYQQAFKDEQEPLHDQLRQLFETSEYYNRFLKSATSHPLSKSESKIIMKKSEELEEKLRKIAKSKAKQKEKQVHEQRIVQENEDLSVLQKMIDGVTPVDRTAVQDTYLHSHSSKVRALARQLASTFVWTLEDD